MNEERDICAKCGWPAQSCDCCGICGEPKCDCAKELNGDQSEPLGEWWDDYLDEEEDDCGEDTDVEDRS
jgi:hypothetical protein